MRAAHASALPVAAGSHSFGMSGSISQMTIRLMPGCRTKRRQRSRSTDYDIVCSMDGFDVDFRSELGRYFEQT